MPRRRKLIAILAVAAALLLYTTWSLAAPHVRSQISPNQFELIIASDKPVYAIGEHPKITATLTNRSGRNIMLIPALDGSDMGRYPLVKFDVTPPQDALPEEVWGRCGNTNPLTPADFQWVNSNGSFDVYGQWGGPAWSALDRGPGEYAIQLAYSTDETDLSRWLGGPLSSSQQSLARLKVGALLGEVPRFTVTSNVLKIRFENPFSGPDVMLRKGTVEQARFALRMIDSGHQIANLADAMAESLVHNVNMQDPQYLLYYGQSLERLSACADEQSLTRIWPLVELQEPGARSHFQNREGELALLKMVLRCPGPNREDPLRKLLTYTERHGHEGTYIDLTPEVVRQTGDVPGEDIDHVLKERFDYSITYGRITKDAFIALRNVLVQRGVVTKGEVENAHPVGLG